MTERSPGAPSGVWEAFTYEHFINFALTFPLILKKISTLLK